VKDRLGTGARTGNARILQLTDCHITPEPDGTVQGLDTERSLAAVVEAVLASKDSYDLVLLTGDLADRPTESAYTRLRQRLSPLRTPGYCLPGNHDDAQAMRQFLVGDGIRMVPRIVLDRWQIVCLDSAVPGEAGGFLSEAQLAILENAAAAEPDRFLLVAVHHHPIACGSAWMDTMMISNADRLLSALAPFSAKARGLVFGHIHQVMDVSAKGLRYLGSPSTCRQFQPRSNSFAVAPSPPGYRWIELTPSGRIRSGVRFIDGMPAPDA
jgi:3',5'-cyclic-AMP phosphodiesterase